MKYTLLTTLVFAFASAAQADQTSKFATAISVQYNGAEAKALFDAFKAANLKANTYTGADKRTVYSVSHIHEKTRWNTALDDSDPCFKIPSYQIQLVDDNANQAKMNIEETDNCQATKAKAIALILGKMGGDDLSDAAMGKSYFTVPSAVVWFDPTKTGKEQYVALADIGPDAQDVCR